MTEGADTIIALYQRHAAAWDRQRGRGLFEKPWLDRFLAAIPPPGAVLDIGCGAGEPMARYMIEKGLRISGVDSAPAMVTLARTRFPQHDWHVADMRSLDLGRSFDGILAWDSFFHLTPDDQRAMFRVFARHAGPGAALMFTSGPAEGVAIGTFENEPLYHASLATGEYRSLLAAHGFAVIAHVADDASCGAHTVWLARRDNQT